jgi:D-alanine-D-alanine ligase
VSQASVVYSEDKLLERVEFLHDRLNTPVLAEEYIAGRELYLSVIGNQQLQTFPALELVFGEMPEDSHNIATSRVKWNWRYQKEHQIAIKPPESLDPQLLKRLTVLGKRIYRILGISGYARVDMRLTEEGQIHVLEVNANPDIGYGDELATSAELAGCSYEQLLQKVLNLGLKYRPELARL